MESITADCEFRLYFKSNDTGANVGKAPYLNTTGTPLRLTISIVNGRNDCNLEFSIGPNVQSLNQGNFNALNTAAAGNTVGYIQCSPADFGQNFSFIPREGFAYFSTGDNLIHVMLVGERPVYQ